MLWVQYIWHLCISRRSGFSLTFPAVSVSTWRHHSCLASARSAHVRFRTLSGSHQPRSVIPGRAVIHHPPSPTVNRVFFQLQQQASEILLVGQTQEKPSVFFFSLRRRSFYRGFSLRKVCLYLRSFILHHRECSELTVAMQSRHFRSPCVLKLIAAVCISMPGRV